ncbi:MAG: hypothetical protein ABI891_13185, partial [Acidobacteriota bacterium]
MKLIQLRVVFAGFVICGFFVLQAFSQTNITESVTNPATVSGKIFVEGKAAANISIGIIKASAG